MAVTAKKMAVREKNGRAQANPITLSRHGTECYSHERPVPSPEIVIGLVSAA